MIKNVLLYVCFIPNVEPQFTHSTNIPSGVHTWVFQQFIILLQPDGGNRDSSSVLVSHWQAHNKTCSIRYTQQVYLGHLISSWLWHCSAGFEWSSTRPHQVIQLTMVYSHKDKHLLSQPYKNYRVLPISYCPSNY